MFFNKLSAPACVKNLSAKILGLTLLALPHYAAAGTYTAPLSDFSFSANGPMGLGRAEVPDATNKGYQMVDSKIDIVASITQQSDIVINYLTNIAFINGAFVSTITADAQMTLYFDLVVTDVDVTYDFYGKLDGASYRFEGIAVTGNFVYDSTTSSFTFDAQGTDITTDIIGVEVALGVDVNGVTADLSPAPLDDPLYLDVIKFNSNDFLNAFSNINITLTNDVLSHSLDFTSAILSGGIQDSYLDPEFSLLMEPQAAVVVDSNVILDSSFDTDLGGWHSVSGGLVNISDFAVTNNSVLIHNRSNMFSGIAYDSKTLLESNETYSLEADVYVTGITDGKFMPRVKSRTGVKNTYTAIGREVLSPGQWHHVVMEFTMPDISQASLVEMQLNGILTSADFYVDNLKVTGKSPAEVEPEAPIDPNGYIINDDFETGQTGWSNVGGSLSVDSVGSGGSVGSLRLSSRTSSMHGIVKSLKDNVSSNTTYILDVDVYIHSEGSSNLIAEIKSKVGAKNTFTRVGKQTIQPGSWNHLSFEVTLPDVTNASLVDLKFYGIISSADFSVDNVQLSSQ